MGSGIKPIDATSIHKITSGQVVIDLATAVKELVENSLDANASLIEVRFRNYGLDLFEVIDNGNGINEDDFAGIALKHHTSKLRKFSDIESVATYGFRGEALNSLCALCPSLQITTCTSLTQPRASKLGFDSQGNLVSNQNTAGIKGTSVAISKLFENRLPVRRLDLVKNSKREFVKAINVLQAYGTIKTNVKFSVTNITSTGKKNILFTTKGNSSIGENIVNIFGVKAFRDLISLSLSFSFSSKSPIFCREGEANVRIEVNGYVSLPAFGRGRSSSDRQLFFINSRPCRLSSIAKIFNEVYKDFNYTQYPFAVVNIQIPYEYIDVNVSPDKRTILLHDEQILAEELKASLTRFFDSCEHYVPSHETPLQDQSPSTFVLKTPIRAPTQSVIVTPVTIESLRTKSIESLRTLDHEDSLSQYISTNESEISHETSNPSSKSQKRNRNTNLTNISSQALREDNFESLEEESSSLHKRVKQESSHSEFESPEVETEHFFLESNDIQNNDPSTESLNKLSEFQKYSVQGSSSDKDEIVSEETTNLIADDRGAYGSSSPSITGEVDGNESSVQDMSIDAPQVVTGTEASIDISPLEFSTFKRKYTTREWTHNTTMVLPVSLNDINKACETYLENYYMPNEVQDTIYRHENLESMETDIAKGENKLQSLRITKNDFIKMNIIGQFNLGFILTLRDNGSKGCGRKDLFVIDQHASDEKYNFEKFQRETKITKQPLVIPQVLDLTPLEELIVISNLKVFEDNGFSVKINEDAEPGAKCSLIAIPMSKSTIFGINDFMELVHLVHESPGISIKCSKLRQMYASRACRASVMIGKALSKARMRRIVENLSQLDKPWNCPHGRPTMRHLMNISEWESWNKDYFMSASYDVQ
ncbi:hypothetical protein V1511DRAFT_506813 [Dipodascopsis uninucleata]